MDESLACYDWACSALLEDGECLGDGSDILGLAGEDNACTGHGHCGGHVEPSGLPVQGDTHEENLPERFLCQHVHTVLPGEGGTRCRHTHTRLRIGKSAEKRDAEEEDHETQGGEDQTGDVVSDERKRNREAVRKYRARKKANIAGMEDELSKLRAENTALKSLLRNVQGLLPDHAGHLAQQIRAHIGDQDTLPTRHLHMPSCSHLQPMPLTFHVRSDPTYAAQPSAMSEPNTRGLPSATPSIAMGIGAVSVAPPQYGSAAPVAGGVGDGFHALSIGPAPPMGSLGMFHSNGCVFSLHQTNKLPLMPLQSTRRPRAV